MFTIMKIDPYKFTSLQPSYSNIYVKFVKRNLVNLKA